MMSKIKTVILLATTLFCCFACNETTPSDKSIGINAITKTDSLEKVATAEKVKPEPPKERPIDFDTTEWMDISYLDSTIIVDMRYATDSNFVAEKMYACNRCFLRPEVAKAIVAIHQNFQKEKKGIKVFDCFRPRPIQQKLWEKVPNASYVTPPKKGSMHNRGSAVDITIVDDQGKELDMGTDFDFFGKEAHHTYMEHDSIINDNRKLLKTTMEDAGFKSIRTEWWHYSYRKKQYGFSDMLWECGKKWEIKN